MNQTLSKFNPISEFRAWDAKENKFYYSGADQTLGSFFCSFELLDDVYLSQATGLKDISGKSIFSGDIVKTVSFGKAKNRVIKYDKERGMFYNNINIITEMVTGTHGMEIVGNIYENPELIEE